jgi:hypothetical protein
MPSSTFLFDRCALPIHRGAAAAWHWRGAHYRTIAGTAVGGVSYFYAIVAAALSGMSY